jgi:hypothetical protein
MVAPPRLSIDPDAVRVILPTPDIGGVAYSPCYVSVRDPLVPGLYEMMYTQGGTFPREIPDNDPRGGMSDPTKVWWRPAGGLVWHPYTIYSFPHFGGGVIADNSVHPWQRDREFMKRHPECWVGSFGAPCVYRDQNGLFHMWRPATVGDPAMTTKRNFVIYHYVSPNGLDWSLVHYQRRHPNVAVQAAALWCGEFTGARDYPSERGLTSVWAVPVPAVNRNEGTVRLFVQCWFGGDGPKVQKNALITMVDRWGMLWSGNAGIGREWDTLDNGQVPDWFYLAEQKPFEDRWTVGNMHAQIIEQFIEPPGELGKLGRYMLVAVPGDGQTPGLPVQVAFTDDLVHTKSFIGPNDEKVSWLEIEGTRGLALNIGTPRIDRDATGSTGVVLRFWTSDAGLITSDKSRRMQPLKSGESFGGAHVCEVPVRLEVAHGQ